MPSPDQLSTIQTLLQNANLRGWLLYDFRGLNPIARRVAPLPEHAFLSRRWAYWIPALGQPAWLVHAIEREPFQHLPEPVLTYSSWQSFEQALLTLTDGPGPIAGEYSPECGIPYVSYIDAGTAEQLRRLGYDLHSSADLIQAVYATWTPAQLASHRAAVRICLDAKDAAFAHIAARLRTGIPTTELDIQQFILDRFAESGLDPDHPPIVAVNGNAGNPHYAPSPAHHSPIRPGDLILIDLWGKLMDVPDAVFADMTWMGYAGENPPAEMRQVFDIVARARDAAIELVERRTAAGETLHGWEVDDAARNVIREAGYGDAFIHRTGHSIDTA
ncbi:MAG TPA: aminopeptidase P family protein, partial [Caldilineae bacterium]|nr:aminopeptidase P family protein [Caldilineae bacterium]